MLKPPLPKNETVQRGNEWYEKLRSVVETPENMDKQITINVATGDYEIHGDHDAIAACHRLFAKQANAPLLGLRVGGKPVYSILTPFFPNRLSITKNPLVNAFASVVVDVDAPGLRQPFTYRIPDELAADGIAPGACIIVPFGTREAIGWVIGLTDAPPEHLEPDAIKPITARVTGDGASVPVAVLQTARWIAQNYLADLAQSVRCALPDSQIAHVTRRYALADDWQTAFESITTPSHRQVIETLATFPDCTASEDEIADAIGGAKITSPIQLLRKRGVLRDVWSVEPPKTGARKVRAVRLVPNWDEAEAQAVSREEKAPAQARLLRALVASGGGPVPQAEILRGAEASPAAAKKLEEAGLMVTETVEVRRRPFRFVAGASVPPMMTAEQEAAVNAIKAKLDTRQANTNLLYGVTASGKTEVYLRAIAETRRRGRTALVLVPEIALTAQVVDTFRARIGDKVAVLHSALSPGERRDEWQRIGRGEADVIVGARSALFAPLQNVGLIVLDEEHENSYKQDNPAPRYHARETAIARARATGATVLLGSATPAVESFYKAEAGRLRIFAA